MSRKSQRVVLKSQAREIISKVYDFMKKEASKNYAEKLTDARWRTAQAAGVSESTVTRILRDRKECSNKQTTVPAIESNIVPSAEHTTESTIEADIVSEDENKASTSYSNLEGRNRSIFTSPMKKKRIAVESTLARNKRPCQKVLPAVAFATQTIQTNTSSIQEVNPDQSNIIPMNFDVKVKSENVVKNAIEKQHDIISWREIIVKKSTEIYLQSNNICDKILHGQVLNTCKSDVKVFVKTPHEKLLDRAFTRWSDWASLTEEPKDPPLFYKCYICEMAWWHLAHFRDHIRIHEPSSLRVVLEMNDFVECNIVAYYTKSANKYIANIEGKCWKCGENSFEHAKLKNCVGCKKRFYTCSKLRQHQWYCEEFKKTHLDLFASAEKIFKCHLCRFYFFKKEDSIEHMILRHSVRSDVPIPGCAVCEKCKDLISYEDDHVCESKGYVKTCGACKKKVTESSAAVHQIEGNFTCSLCKVKIVKTCSIHLHALSHTMNYGLAYKCLTCKFFIIFDLEQIKKHKMFYHSNRNFDYDLISVPKTIVDRLKSTPTKHDSPVYHQSQRNSIPLSRDLQDNVVNDSDDDDVIIVDDVPEVIVIPSEDAPNDDLPCVIANIKSEPLENEIQISETKITVDNAQSDFHSKTMVIQIPKDPKGVFKWISEGDIINDDNELNIDEIKREPNSEPNVAMESSLGIIKTSNVNKVNTHRTQYVHSKETSNGQTVKATPVDITKSLINIKKSMDLTYKEMEYMKKHINNSSTNQTEVDVEKILPLAFVKRKCSQRAEVIQKMQKSKKIKKLRQYKPKFKQTVLTNISQNSESDLRIEVIKSVDVMEKEELITVDLSDTEFNSPNPEEGRLANITNNFENNTSQESEVTEPKEDKFVESVVEIEIPWNTVPIKEEADPEMDLKLSDIRRIYHIDVNVGENEIDVKREINEFDLTGQSENWHQDNSTYSHHSSDDEFENDLITITPNVTLDTDNRRNRTHGQNRKLYSCIRCNFKGVHRLYKQHKRYECQKSNRLYSYHCSLCEKSFDSMHNYLLHFEKHGVPKLICPQCGQGGISLNSLSVHVKMHIKSLFLAYRTLDADDTMKTPVLKCKVCDADVTRPDFIKHWDSHLDLKKLNRRLKSSEVLEPQLPHGFQTLDHDDKPDVNKALDLFLNPEKLMDLERTNFRECVLCARNFKRRNDCKRHLIEHFLKNAYASKTQFNGLKCQICGDVFDKIDMFRGHMRLHACLPVYKCEICNRTFSDSSNFSKHKKVHNFQILICDICKKKFNNKAYLIKHVQEHENTPLIKCDKCKKTFVCKTAYKKHYRTYHSVRVRFRCHECSELFSTTRDKWDHMWNVHREREVQADCNLCDAKYRKRSDLKRHFTVVHKRKAPDIIKNAYIDVVNVKSEPE